MADRTEKAATMAACPARATMPRAAKLAFATAPIVALDMLAAFAGMVIAYSLRYSLPTLTPEGLREDPLIQPYMPLIVFAPFIRAFACHTFDLYGTRAHGRRSGEEAFRVFKATCLGSVILILVAFLYRGTIVREDFEYSRYIFAMDWLLNLFFVVGVHTLFIAVHDELRRRGLGTRRVAVQGRGAVAHDLLGVIQRSPELGFAVAGVVPPEGETEGLEVDGRRLPSLGSLDDLRHLVNAHRLDEIIVTDATRLGCDVMDFVEQCHKLGVVVKIVPDLYGVLLHGRALQSLAGMPVIQVNEIAIVGLSRLLKRTEDVFLSLLGILLTGPLMLLTALAIKLDSRGPILFRQDRVGTNGRVFTVYKFRSMRQDAERLRAELDAANESDGFLFKMKRDPRITRVGRIIRKLSIDELPQLFNILKGDMSLVGPRPLPVSDYEKNGDWDHARLTVTPGITGMWQVNRVCHTSEEMARWDLYYVENWSLWLDLKIILKTFWVVFMGKGAC